MSAVAERQLQAQNELKMRKILAVLEEFEELSVSQIEALLLVALHEGASLSKLVALSGKAQSTMSRGLLDLCGHPARAPPPARSSSSRLTNRIFGRKPTG
jgi:hypothetical protein